MERLTKVIAAYGKNVVVYTRGKYEDTTAGEMEVKDVRNVMGKLSDYENTGLNPEQIMELVERNKSKPPIYQVQGDERYGQEPEWWMCPGCEEVYDMDDDYDFCPNCGQRILR